MCDTMASPPSDPTLSSQCAPRGMMRTDAIKLANAIGASQGTSAIRIAPNSGRTANACRASALGDVNAHCVVGSTNLRDCTAYLICASSAALGTRFAGSGAPQLKLLALFTSPVPL